MIGLFLFGNSLNAQIFYNSGNPDISAVSGISNAQNTGNYSISFENSYFQVMCWDGDQPGIGWGKDNNPESSFQFDGSNIGAIEDPDVVLYAVNNNLYAFFIYLITGNAYYERWEYSAGNWNIYTNATLLAGTTGNCSTPNVDIDDQNHLAAVWQEGNTIKLITGNIQSVNNMYTILAGSSSQTYETPDVSVLHDNSSPYLVNINITYLNNSNGNYNFNVDWFEFYYPTSTYGNFYSLQLNSSYTYGKPRIAAPVYTANYFHYKDFSAVIREFDGSRYNLLSITRFHQQNSPLMTANSYPDITSSICTEPAITYINDNIFIAFKTNYINGNDFDIFQKRLNYKGDIGSYNYYSVVNDNTIGDQTTPSISGRYGLGLKAFYTFSDNYSGEILYKNSYYTNQNLRVSKKIADAYIYPNPASGSFTLNLKDFSKPSSISISDVQGKILINQLIKDSQSQIDINSLKPGIYFVNILNKDNNITKILNVK